MVNLKYHAFYNITEFKCISFNQAPYNDVSTWSYGCGRNDQTTTRIFIDKHFMKRFFFVFVQIYNDPAMLQIKLFTNSTYDSNIW